MGGACGCGKQDALEDVFVGRLVESWADRGRPRSFCEDGTGLA